MPGIPDEHTLFTKYLLIFPSCETSVPQVAKSGGETGLVLYRFYPIAPDLQNPLSGFSYFLNSTLIRTDKGLDAAHVAAYVARLPILAIQAADEQLPRMPRGQNGEPTTDKPYTLTSLEVNWTRVVATASAIIGGGIVTIGLVLYYCRGVYGRDGSLLSTSRLLKTIMERVSDNEWSLGTGEELAAYLDGAGPRVRYGTKEFTKDGGGDCELEGCVFVDIANEDKVSGFEGYQMPGIWTFVRQRFFTSGGRSAKLTPV